MKQKHYHRAGERAWGVWWSRLPEAGDAESTGSWFREGEVAQSIKCLPDKHKEPLPSTHLQSQTWWHSPVVIALRWGSETEGSLTLAGQPV